MRKILLVLVIVSLVVTGLTSFKVISPLAIRHSSLPEDTLHYPDEKHFKNINN
jgi:hypothetical protein